MATTLLELIKRIADLFGPMHEGTAEAGGTVRDIVDHTLIEPEDYWINHYVYVTGAGGTAPEGQERVVSDWVQSTGTLSVSPDFTAAIDSGDTYLVLSARRAELVRAINDAIDKACKKWAIPTIDTTTVTIAASTYQYTLPTDLIRLNDILYRADSQSPYRTIERALWTVSGTVGAQVLDLLDISGFSTGVKLRLDYVKRLPQLVTDTSQLAIGAPAEPQLILFLTDWSLYYLHTQAANRGISAGTFREHLTMAKNAKESALKMLDSAPRWERPGRWHTPQRPSIRG